MRSIILINCYFGKLPSYFNYYLKSVSYNKTVNFLLVTDDKGDYHYPDNVKVLYSSLAEIKDKLHKVLGFEPALNSSYKLCDFRPTYGEVFFDEIKNYDYWGYADIDLIFGDIRNFLTDEVLNGGYDKIQTAGHFTIMPTKEEHLTFYKKDIGKLNYKKVYTDDKNYAFDEWPGLASIYQQAGKKIYNEVNDFADLSVFKWHFLPSEEVYRRYCGEKTWESHNTIFVFDSGKLYNYSLNYEKNVVRKECMYVHFQKRIVRCRDEEPKDIFTILPPGKIVNEMYEINRKFLKKNAPENRVYFHILKIRFKNLLKRLKK